MGVFRTGLDRRRFLGTAGAAAAALGAAPGYLSAQTPVRGGDLVMALPGASTGNSLDPRSYNSPYMSAVSGVMFNTLVEVISDTGEPSPGLATSWEESENGLVWRFELAQNVTFHNGQPMTSADVIYSLMWHISEGSRSNSRPIIFAIDTIEPDGDHAVVIRLRSPNYFYPASLSNYSLVIMPDGTTEFDGIGTGPYQLTRFVPGEILESRRFDGYFRDDRAFVDTVTLLGVNDDNARVSALQTGQAHLSTLLDPRSVTLLESLPTVAINYLPSSTFSGLNMMVDRPPFDNLQLRQALKYAIDRQDIIDRIYFGKAQLGNDTPIPPSAPDFAKDVEQLAYDPDRARALYGESGHSGPIVLQTSNAAGGGAVDMATLIAEHAERAGITIEVQREPADGYWANIWAQAPFHATLWGTRPTSDMIMTLAYSSGSPANDTGFANESFDAALAQARGAASAEERAAGSATAQTILSQEGGVLIPAFGNTVEGIAANLQGYVPTGIIASGYRAPENVWFG